MKQALHIFKKDVRYLRYEIMLELLVVLAFCFLGTHNMHGPGPVAFILPVTWWFLIARVIHAEALPSSRQFWLTRPYAWKSLLGAKVLFILAFINLPLLIADAVIVHAAGFSIAEEFAGLLWTQVLLTTVFLLPAAALSAITSGLAEMLVVTLLLVIIALARLLVPSAHWNFYWMESEWVKTYYLVTQIAAAAAIVLLWQYACRRTFVTRTIIGVAALAVVIGSALLPWRAAFALETHLSRRDMEPASIRIELDANRKWMGRIYSSGQGQIVAELPLQVSGLPNGTILKPNGLTVTLRSSDGETWIVHRPPPDSFDFESGITSLQAAMSRAFYEKVKDRPLQFRGTLYFTLYGNERNTPIPVNGAPVPVNGVGLCSAAARYLLCNSAFRQQSGWAAFRLLQATRSGTRTTTENLSRIGSYSPFPADINVDPLIRFFSPQLTAISEASVETWEPIAHLERNFEMDGVRLDDFAVSPDLLPLRKRTR
ncbi:MAG: hypothetical protein ACRD45_21795 [Bryobacteraceae bacterium]